MSVTLKITAGPCAGTQIVVPRGQIAHVGRTRWADHSLPGDTKLADVHFIVDYEAAHCRIRDASGDAGTMVNDERILDARLHSGDTVAAGQSTFLIIVQGEPLPASGHGDGQDGAAENAVGPKLAADYCKPLDMGEEARALLKKNHRPIEYLDVLIAQSHYPDAIRFLAFWLPKPMAVGWAVSCLDSIFGDTLAAKDKTALERARAWAAEPDEARRRAAEAAAEATNYEGPAAFVALAAFWSGGSLTPPEMAVVPPGEHLTAQAILAALLMAAPHGNPALAADRYRAFLQDGKLRAAALPKE